jgi:hypothetical protein
VKLVPLLLAAICLANAMEHTHTEFEFTLGAPYSRVAPLFGALAEQNWDPEWKPRFLYPTPPADREGAVFRVERPGQSSVWVNTLFDLATGRVQYVYVVDGVMATRIDIRLTREGDAATHVVVAYERTALEDAAAAHVRSLAKSDAGNGPEWKAAIEAYLAKAGK